MSMNVARQGNRQIFYIGHYKKWGVQLQIFKAGSMTYNEARLIIGPLDSASLPTNLHKLGEDFKGSVYATYKGLERHQEIDKEGQKIELFRPTFQISLSGNLDKVFALIDELIDADILKPISYKNAKELKQRLLFKELKLQP